MVPSSVDDKTLVKTDEENSSGGGGYSDREHVYENFPIRGQGVKPATTTGTGGKGGAARNGVEDGEATMRPHSVTDEVRIFKPSQLLCMWTCLRNEY